MWLVPWIWSPLLPSIAYSFLKGPNSSGLAQHLEKPQRVFPGTGPESGRAGRGVYQGVSASLQTFVGPLPLGSRAPEAGNGMLAVTEGKGC